MEDGLSSHSQKWSIRSLHTLKLGIGKWLGDDDSLPKSKIWDDCSEELKEAYRDFVRNLPNVLAKVDFQIYRLT